MKKSLIVLAIAGAFVAPVAMADVTVYGQANMSIDSVKNGVVNNSGSARKLSDNVSRIGFKGSEDLGDGLSAVFQVETGVSLDGAAAPTTLGSRNTFVGLSSGSMGTVLAGRHDTPYKLATRGLDVFGDSIADNRNLMGHILGSTTHSHDTRVTDVVAYISPAFSGVTVAAAYVLAGEASAQGVSDKRNALSLAAMFKADAINASVAYQKVNGGNTTTNTAQQAVIATTLGRYDNAAALKIGGGFSTDLFTVNAVIERTSGMVGGTGENIRQNNTYVAGKFNVSASDAVKVAFTHAGSRYSAGARNANNTSANQYAVGFDHSLSKRTTVFALYTKLNNTANASYSLGGETTGTVAGVANSNPSALSLGMKHSF